MSPFGICATIRTHGETNFDLLYVGYLYYLLPVTISTDVEYFYVSLLQSVFLAPEKICFF